MQTLSYSICAVELGGSGTDSGLLAGAFVGRRSPPQRATLWRSLRRRKGGKVGQPISVRASSRAHRPTSPLFGAAILSWALQNSARGKMWTRSVASPPRENLDPSSDFAEESKESLSAAEADGKEAPFEWKSNWYPVFPEIDADKAVPHAFQILGRKVVIWYDKGAARWRTFLDMCPHRLAPLSEGRIDAHGCLQCCYHGWSFEGDGTCMRIPQALGAGPEAKATRNNMARCVSFPTVVKQGLLFIWPDENGHELAEKTPPPVTPGIEDEGWTAVCTFRDLDYGYDTGMENLVDPSHVPVAHHGVNGGMMGKREHAAPIQLEVKHTHPRGFEGRWNKPHGGEPSVHTFDAPSRFTYRFQLKGIKGATGSTTTYCTPIAPGRSRILVINARNFMTHLSSGPAWWQLFPRWMDHQMMLNLFDGDLTLLHDQERNLREVTTGQVEKWSKAFFMPTAADRYVGAFRQWLTRFGGKGVAYAAGVGPTLPPQITKREDLLDRYNSHTKQCVCCSKALENFKKARTVLAILAVGLTGAAAVLTQTGHRYSAVGGAAVFALLAWHLGGWIQMFYYKGWDHARLA